MHPAPRGFLTVSVPDGFALPLLSLCCTHTRLGLAYLIALRRQSHPPLQGHVWGVRDAETKVC